MAARQWTESQKAKQKQLIEHWKPWQNSKGVTTPEGKAKICKNALKHGNYSAAQILERSKIKAQIDAEIFDLESKVADLKKDLDFKIKDLKRQIEPQIFELKSQILDLKSNRKQFTNSGVKHTQNATLKKKWANARAEYENGGTTLRQLADKLGVSVKTVERRSQKELWQKNKTSLIPQNSTPKEAQIIEQKTLIDLLPQSQETSNHDISPFSELLEFITTNNIEVHTRQSA